MLACAYVWYWDTNPSCAHLVCCTWLLHFGWQTQLYRIWMAARRIRLQTAADRRNLILRKGIVQLHTMLAAQASGYAP